VGYAFQLATTYSSGVFFGIAMQQGGSTCYTSFRDSSTGTDQMSFLFANDGTGTIRVYRGAPGGTLIGTVVGAFIGATAWHYIAISGTISATVGTAQVQIDGVLVLNLTGLNNKGSTGSTFDKCCFGSTSGAGGGFVMGIDDAYICDSSGSAPLNTFLGDVCAETPMPSADDVVQFAPSSGANNFSRVNETAMDGDTSYNSSNTPGQQDTFAHAALTGSPTTIFAVQTVNSWRKDDVATHTAKAVLKSNATTVFGATVGVASSYAYQKDIFPLDPDTGLPWTPSGANACKTGYNLVS
jgi:hypothetical protein